MKRFIPAVTLVLYSAILVKVMVFKDMPVIRIGHLMFKFGGRDGGGTANFIPFRTVARYLSGENVLIGGVNLIGNIALLVPIGLLAPVVFKNLTWKKSLSIAVAAGLSIESAQAALDIGVFDVDDVTLNALGVMLGYWVFMIFAKLLRGGPSSTD